MLLADARADGRADRRPRPVPRARRRRLARSPRRPARRSRRARSATTATAPPPACGASPPRDSGRRPSVEVRWALLQEAAMPSWPAAVVAPAAITWVAYS